MTLITAVRQGSAEWLHARIGKVTASRIRDVMAYRKDGKESTDRANYRTELLCEILTGVAAEHYVSPYMDHGTEKEDLARAAYEISSGNIVDQVGFFPHPVIDRAGASPDGFVGQDGLLEIKAPKTETHIKWMLSGEVPAEHADQMHFQMACTGRAWCDFVSFDDRLPLELQLFTKRLMRDDARIATIEAEVITLLEEVVTIIEVLQKAVGPFSFGLPKQAEEPSPEYIGGLTDEDIEAAIRGDI